MDRNETIAGKAKESMHSWLIRFSTRHGSPHKAAGMLKTDGLSFQWIKGFAGGQITNPTVDKLRLLEKRLIELEEAEASKVAA